jgi:hypothetical protein
MRSALTPASMTVAQAPSQAQATIVSSNLALPMATSIAAPSGPSLLQQAEALQISAAHAQALAQQRAIVSAITKLQPTWSPLPLGPYPPATDNTGFPRTGDPSLIVSASKVTADQLAEPTRYAQGLADQAAARRPQLSGMFWLGLACLGLGIYIHKQR